jgi:lipopolysaccharide export system protein LptA
MIGRNPVGGDYEVMRMNWRTVRTIALPVLAAVSVHGLAPGRAEALPEDRNQPIYIQSDRAERDERSGKTVYTGDVVIDQGSLHIAADRVTITMQESQVSRIDAVGKPAKMNQKPSPEREMVYARAINIQYDVTAEILTLIEQATVVQEGSTVQGERIDYFVKEQRVKAGAGPAESGDSRVQMVIQPRHVAPATAAPEGAQPPTEGKVDGAP